MNPINPELQNAAINPILQNPRQLPFGRIMAISALALASLALIGAFAAGAHGASLAVFGGASNFLSSWISLCVGITGLFMATYAAVETYVFFRHGANAQAAHEVINPLNPQNRLIEVLRPYVANWLQR
jgi:hypothetical protein